MFSTRGDRLEEDSKLELHLQGPALGRARLQACELQGRRGPPAGRRLCELNPSRIPT